MSVIANDASALLLDQVNRALAAKTPLRIQGSGSSASSAVRSRVSCSTCASTAASSATTPPSW